MYQLLSRISIEDLEQAVFDGQIMKRVLCLFDHWLTEQEADIKMLSYQTIHTDDSKKRYFQAENKFIKFFDCLYEKYEKIIYRYDEGPLLNFSSRNDFLKKIRDSLREKKFVHIYISELEVVLSGSYDLNVIVYSSEIDNLTVLAEIVHKKGLYLLM